MQTKSFILCIVFLLSLSGCGGEQTIEKHTKTIASDNKSSVRDAQLEYAQTTKLEPEIKVNLGNGVTLQMVLIPSGNFQMGSTYEEIRKMKSEGQRLSKDGEEAPQHEVTIKDGFYMCKTEITQQQWLALMPENPSVFQGDNNPVETSNLDDVNRFIELINSKVKEGGFRLPSEAEWEYACRAGSTTRFYFGDNTKQLEEYAWFDINSAKSTHPVAQKKPNKWGLYDMYGNVAEWCEDDVLINYERAPSNGKAWIGIPRGDMRVLRGGDWQCPDWQCRSAYRGGSVLNKPISWGDGFRLVKDVAVVPAEK